MPSLADLLENYRNWKGRQDWQSGKEMQDYFGGDPVAQEQFEKLSGFGTADLGGLSGLAGAIKASHGSPHAFEKFDFSKIGTGEGAQAYGHGGYFGQGFDSPVAKEYQRQLAGKDEGIVGQIASNAIKGRTPEQAIDYLTPTNNMTKEAAQVQQQAIDLIKQGLASKGHLYNVELKWPDAAREASDPLGEHHLLDWDAPIAEQPEYVRKALAGLNDKYVQEALTSKPELVDDGDYWKYLGETYDTKRDALEDVTPMQLIAGSRGSFKSPKDVSEKLKALGIPGIRYLDQGSRSAGTGSRNYVMFDDQFPNIVSRNGASLSDLLDTSYQSGHTAPGPDFGAQLHDLTGGGQMYPQDIYSKNAASLYGHGGGHEAIDKKAMSLVQMLRNQPEALVDIYRAVPKNESISSINPGDWVTITKEYAKEHGEGPLRGDYKILKQKVPAKSIWTNADSIHEYGYWPD